MCKYLLALILFPWLLRAQVAEVPLVMYAAGPVDYADKAGRGAQTPVVTGHYLTGSGMLSLGPDAVLEIARGDAFIRLETPGKFSVDELFGEDAAASAGFIDRFLQFIRRGLDQSASSANLERAYLENQGNAEGNIEGFGDSGLAGLLPFGGTLLPELTTFRWPAEGTAESYRLRVVDSLTEAVILSAVTKDTTVQLDLTALQLQDGRAYYWEVFANAPPSSAPKRLGVQAPSVVGTRIDFRFRDTSAGTALDSLQDTPFYRATASEAQRSLMEAMTYEAADLLYAADEAYRRGLTQESDNLLLRRTYAAFLSRWNQRKSARDLLQIEDR